MYHFQQELAIKQHLLPANHPRLAASLVNVAVICGDLGDFQQEIHYQQQALAIYEQCLPVADTRIMLCLFNIGFAFGGLGDFQSKLHYMQRALALRDANPTATANSPQAFSRNLYHIGDSYRRLGYHEQAVQYLRRALTIMRDQLQLPPEHAHMVQVLKAMSESYVALGDIVKQQECNDQLSPLHCNIDVCSISFFSTQIRQL